MSRTRFVLPLILGACLTGCGDTAHLEVIDGTGPAPQLPAPDKTLIPTDRKSVV